MKKIYRAWHFDSKGTAVSSLGTWDADKATMTWKGDFGNGITGTNTVRFVGADAVEWHLIAGDGDRKIVLDMSGKFKRRTKE